LSDLRRDPRLFRRGRILYKLHSGRRNLCDPELVFKDFALVHDLDVLPQRNDRLDPAIGLLGIA
jgi:hypothetical protein